MADDTDSPAWPPMLFAEQLQQAGEDAMKQQAEMYRQFLDAGSTDGMGGLGSLNPFTAASLNTATFKTRVQSGGRISIPDAEREALDIGEGDIVQTVVVPVKRGDE